MSLLLLYRPQNLYGQDFLAAPDGVKWREEEKQNIKIAKQMRLELEDEIAFILEMMDDDD